MQIASYGAKISFLVTKPGSTESVATTLEVTGGGCALDELPLSLATSLEKQLSLLAGGGKGEAAALRTEVLRLREALKVAASEQAAKDERPKARAQSRSR